MNTAVCGAESCKAILLYPAYSFFSLLFNSAVQFEAECEFVLRLMGSICLYEYNRRVQNRKFMRNKNSAASEEDGPGEVLHCCSLCLVAWQESAFEGRLVKDQSSLWITGIYSNRIYTEYTVFKLPRFITN